MVRRAISWVHGRLDVSKRWPPGEYVWHGPDSDRPVTVTGYLGVMNGEHYLAVEGSLSGVPASEVRKPS